VLAVAWEVGGHRLASGSDDGSARVFTVSTGATVASWTHGGPVLCIAWHPAGDWLVTGSRDNQVRIFDAAEKAEIANWTLPAEVVQISFSPLGSWLLAVSRPSSTAKAHDSAELPVKGAVEVFDITRLFRVAEWTSNSSLNLFTAACWSPSDGVVAMGANDGKVQVHGVIDHVMAVEWSRCRVLWCAHLTGKLHPWRTFSSDIVRKICSFLVLHR